MHSQSGENWVQLSILDNIGYWQEASEALQIQHSKVVQEEPKVRSVTRLQAFARHLLVRIVIWWWHYMLIVCYITHYHHLIIYEYLYLAIGRMLMIPLLSDGFQNGELFSFTLSYRTRKVLQLHGVRVPDGFLYCKILIGLLILLIHDPKDDFIMLPGTILRPEGFPKLADLVGHSARVQDTRKAEESCHARDLPHNLSKSKAGRCRSRVLVNTSTLQKRNRSFGSEPICQSFFYWFHVIWLHEGTLLGLRLRTCVWWKLGGTCGSHWEDLSSRRVGAHILEAWATQGHGVPLTTLTSFIHLGKSDFEHGFFT